MLGPGLIWSSFILKKKTHFTWNMQIHNVFLIKYYSQTSCTWTDPSLLAIGYHSSLPVCLPTVSLLGHRHARKSWCRRSQAWPYPMQQRVPWGVKEGGCPYISGWLEKEWRWKVKIIINIMQGAPLVWQKSRPFGKTLINVERTFSLEPILQFSRRHINVPNWGSPFDVMSENHVLYWRPLLWGSWLLLYIRVKSKIGKSFPDIIFIWAQMGTVFLHRIRKWRALHDDQIRCSSFL